MQEPTKDEAASTATEVARDESSDADTHRTESVHEVVDCRGVALTADRAEGRLRGVKLLGMQSRNGRVYTESALRSAIGLYEGAKVNVNHPSGDPLAPRDYRDRIGVVRNIHLRPGKGLFGDLHCNPKHPLAEQLAWDAEHAPENVGLSHNVVARTRRDESGLVVEAIKRVQSVDLVADPATTLGLYEHRCDGDRYESGGDDGGSSTPSEDAVAELAADSDVALGESLRRIEEQLGAIRRQVLVESLLRRSGFGVDEGPVSSPPSFLRQLYEADDDESVTRLIEERASELKLRGPTKPKPAPAAAERRDLPEDTDLNRGAEAFLAAITRA